MTSDADRALGLIAPVNVKNGWAVAAGYLGLGSLICVGPILGIPAVILGVIALKKPELGGKGRAYTGIVTGAFSSIAYPMFFLYLQMQSG